MGMEEQVIKNSSAIKENEEKIKAIIRALEKEGLVTQEDVDRELEDVREESE